MKVYINNELIELPIEVRTVSDLVEWKRLPEATTAVAVEDRLVPRKNWTIKQLEDNARITLISAAFGG